MTDKPLPFAELLARQAADSVGEEDKPLRHRRRRLGDGGISVAELTGQMSVIDAKPIEPRHSTQPLDGEPDPNLTTADELAEAKQEESLPAPEGNLSDDSCPPEVSDIDDEPDDEVDAGVEEEKEEPVDCCPPLEADVDEGEEHGVDAAALLDEAQRTAAGSAALADVVREKEVVSGVPDGVILKVVDQRDPIQMTTGHMTAITEEDIARVQAYRAGQGGNPVPVHPEAIPPMPAEELPKEKVSIVAVFMLAVISVVVAAGIFKGFEFLWATYTQWMVGVGAVVVAGAIMGLVKLMRTEKDGVAMTLAGIAGLAVTFGPLLVTVLSAG